MYEQNISTVSTALRRAGASVSNAINSTSESRAIHAPQQYLPPNTVINMSNSNDVVIGSSTVYQAPVTIYMDATVEGHSRVGITADHHMTNQQISLLQRFQSLSKPSILFIILFIVCLSLIIYFLVDKLQKKEPNRDILFGNNYDTGTFPNLGNGHLVIDRDQWGAQEKNCTRILENPIPYVLITHVGVQSAPCSNVYRCSIKMRTLQDASIAEQGKCDITANFYVGEDGNIYVGRGWKIVNFYSDKTLAIAFLGDYLRNEPGDRQLEAAEHLIVYGVTNNHISLDYKLVAANQTKKTKSPGINVYKHIKKWPHWYACGMNNSVVCGKEIDIPAPWNGLD